jgi:heme-degrading monooxygenase HmoA
MYVVMNVVNAKAGHAADFEESFFNRERLVQQADGFAGFELLRRDRENEYVVLSRWETQADFKAWLKSDLFRKAHSHLDQGRSFAHGNEVRMYERIDEQVPA